MRFVKSLLFRTVCSVMAGVLLATTLILVTPRVEIGTNKGLVSISFAPQVAYAATESLYPTGQVTWTNLDGSYLDIDDDPDSPDGNWADAVSDSADVLAHVSFNTPSGNPTPGAGLQNFKIWARRSTALSTPTIYADLYEGGVYVGHTSLTATSVTSDSGQLFTGTWDAASLGTPNGSAVEAYIYGTKAGSDAGSSFTARTETYARGSSLTTPFNFTVNKAGGTVDGDIMFMFLTIYIATPPTVDSIPAGWTLVATNTTTNMRWYVYYKIASGEGASYAWSLTASCRYYAENIAYSSGAFNVASLSDITPISNTLYPTAGTIVRAASMNVLSANSPLVYFASIYNTSVQTFTKPILPTTGWVEDADEGHATPDLSLTIGSMIWAGSGLTGNMDVTCIVSITTYKHAFAIALKPATAYFGITDSSSVQTDQTISVTGATWTGGNPWTHSDTATPGDMTVGLKSNRGGTWGVGDVVVKNAAPNYIYENNAAGNDYAFGLGLSAPTNFTDGAEKTNTVRVSAAAG